MTIPGGTVSAQDYYGPCLSNSDFSSLGYKGTNDSPCAAGTSWPSSGWTRPIFGAGNLNLGVWGSLIASVSPGACYAIPQTIGHITIDNIEMTAWGVSMVPNASACYGVAVLLGGAISQAAGPGTIVENVYIHDYVENGNVSYNCVDLGGGNGGCPPYAMVDGAAIFRNSIISDQNGYFFSGGTKINSVLSGGCAGCGEAYGNHVSYVWMGCSSVNSCHDNEFDHQIQYPAYNYMNVHGHVIYEDATSGYQTAFYAYNNAVHDNQPGLLLNMYYHSYIFNNVFWNNGKAAIYLYGNCPGCGASQDNSSQVGYVANNTMDMTSVPAGNDPGNCYSWSGSTGVGTLHSNNNICIPGTGGVGGFSVASLQASNNYTMPSSEANTYGFTSAQKYAPSSSDPQVAGQGANLSSMATGNLADTTARL
jgi:hypothetical protein